MYYHGLTGRVVGIFNNTCHIRYHQLYYVRPCPLMVWCNRDSYSYYPVQVNLVANLQKSTEYFLVVIVFLSSVNVPKMNVCRLMCLRKGLKKSANTVTDECDSCETGSRMSDGNRTSLPVHKKMVFDQ
ncbi:unnamed protein product [Dicrocoelium dendriticum]|nr:unnamed protein product [Dicrocoelium dendriticum]